VWVFSWLYVWVMCVDVFFVWVTWVRLRCICVVCICVWVRIWDVANGVCEGIGFVFFMCAISHVCLV
jgi:hypothetical protein